MDLSDIPALGSLRERQHDVVSRRQLLRLGIDDRTMTRQVRSGRWQRMAPAIYLLVATPATIEQRRVGAALYAGTDAQVTGAAALHWYGFRYAPSTDRITMLVPHATRRRSVGAIVIQRTLELDARPREGGNYRVVSPARAAVDACRSTNDLGTVRAVLAEAVQAGHADLLTISEELRRAKRSRTALANRVFLELTDGVRSLPEAELRELVESSQQLPPFRWNPRLVAEDGTVLPTPDGYLSSAGIALEVDSREHHMTGEDFERTLRRSNLLSWYGVIVLHFTPAEIRREPRRVLRVIEGTYAQRIESPVHVAIRDPSLPEFGQ